MPRNKIPTAILDARGAFITHPESKRPHEPKSDRPLGKPPKWMSDEEKEVWQELSDQALPGVIKESDRNLFALLVRLTAKMQSNEALRVGEMAVLISLGSRFAMTPADRCKVTVEQPKESALEKFISKRTPAPTEKV
jgi:phage terminase small subunit